MNNMGVTRYIIRLVHIEAVTRWWINGDGDNVGVVV